MTDTWLEEIEELCAKATPGPWIACTGSGTCECTSIHSDASEDVICDFLTDYMLKKNPKKIILHDLKFVEASREAIPCLISEVKRLREENERLREEISIQHVDENTSDGYHTFKELYDHRIALFVALMKSHPKISWRANNHDDGTMFDGWFIAGMNLPAGMISYHLPVCWWNDLAHIGIATSLRAPKWDGHTPSDVIDRLVLWKPNV